MKKLLLAGGIVAMALVGFAGCQEYDRDAGYGVQEDEALLGEDQDIPEAEGQVGEDLDWSEGDAEVR